MHHALPEDRVPVSTYAYVLGQCRDSNSLLQGKYVHEHIRKFGHEGDTFLGNLLVQMYGKCRQISLAREAFDQIHHKNVFSWTLLLTAYAQNGHLTEAKQTFDSMHQRNVVSWNTLITAYARTGDYNSALYLLRVMDLDGVAISDVTILIALECCGEIRALYIGRDIHQSDPCENAFLANPATAPALVTMYGRCSSLQEATWVFKNAPVRNVILWTAMLDAYAQNGYYNDAVTLFRVMILNGVKPDTVAIISFFDACSGLSRLEECDLISFLIRYSNFIVDVRVNNAAVNMFGKCGNIERAEFVFKRIPERNLVSWTAMISAYAQNGHPKEALDLFRSVDLEGMKPDSITFVSAVDACANLGDAEVSKLIHQECSVSVTLNSALTSALIKMYGQCECVNLAKHVFDKFSPFSNMGAWNSMISAYAQNGQALEAVNLFAHMDLEGISPNRITLITVLDACANTPSVMQNRFIHSSIVECVLHRMPVEDLPVQNALMNMYARCGKVDKARSIFCKLVGDNKGDIVTWTTMVEAYARNGLGDNAFVTFLEMELEGLVPNEISFTSIASACTHSGLVDLGLFFFASRVVDHGIVARNDMPYNGIVDLLGRAGDVDRAENVVDYMPFEPHSATLTVLLSACRLHGDYLTASRVAGAMVLGEPGNRAAYQLLSNMLAEKHDDT